MNQQMRVMYCILKKRNQKKKKPTTLKAYSESAGARKTDRMSVTFMNQPVIFSERQ